MATEERKKRSIPAKIGRQTGAALAVAISAGATLYAFTTFSTAVFWVEHALEVKQATSEWMAMLLDAEASERSYVVGGSRALLEPYVTAVGRVHSDAARLRELTIDNRIQEPNVDVAERAAVACLDGMQQGIDLVESGHEDLAAEEIASGASKTRLDDFRHAVQTITAEENRLLALRTRAERLREVAALVSIGVFSGVTVYLVFAIWAAGRAAESAQRAAAAAQAVALAEREAASERARTQRFQESFIAVLGHDLRNPLNSISMVHQLLLRKALPPEVVSPLRRAKSACERMLRMIDQILDFTRSRLAGGIPLAPGDMDLEVLVREVVGESRLAHPERAIAVETEGDLHGRWDNDRLAQVVSNLVGNALTHGAAGAPVRISARATLETVEMHVVNDGEIPSEVRERLFDPFRRASRETKSAGAAGLGLGLFIAEQIIRQHGGSLSALSSAGTTSFVVQLPRDAAFAANQPQQARGNGS